MQLFLFNTLTLPTVHVHEVTADRACAFGAFGVCEGMFSLLLRSQRSFFCQLEDVMVIIFMGANNAKYLYSDVLHPQRIMHACARCSPV